MVFECVARTSGGVREKHFKNSRIRFVTSTTTPHYSSDPPVFDYINRIQASPMARAQKLVCQAQCFAHNCTFNRLMNFRQRVPCRAGHIKRRHRLNVSRAMCRLVVQHLSVHRINTYIAITIAIAKRYLLVFCVVYYIVYIYYIYKHAINGTKTSRNSRLSSAQRALLRTWRRCRCYFLFPHHKTAAGASSRYRRRLGCRRCARTSEQTSFAHRALSGPSSSSSPSSVSPNAPSLNACSP